jgi:hypothetical protein
VAFLDDGIGRRKSSLGTPVRPVDSGTGRRLRFLLFFGIVRSDLCATRIVLMETRRNLRPQLVQAAWCVGCRRQFADGHATSCAVGPAGKSGCASRTLALPANGGPAFGLVAVAVPALPERYAMRALRLRCGGFRVEDLHGLIAHAHHEDTLAGRPADDRWLRVEAREDADGAPVGIFGKKAREVGELF